MNDKELNLWRQKFEESIKAIEVEFDAFFLSRNISDYYRLSPSSSNLTLEIDRRDELPVEIVERITHAYLNAKPRLKE